jgi:hypothetical protein
MDKTKLQTFLSLLEKLKESFHFCVSIFPIHREMKALLDSGKDREGLAKACLLIEQARHFTCQHVVTGDPMGDSHDRISDELDKQLHPFYTWAKASLTQWEIETK